MLASLDGSPGLQGTVTVLTGAQAGQAVAIDHCPITIGRAADADLIVQESGVGRHHTRFARTREGDFYAEDLGAEGGTLLDERPIGIALLQSDDRLQLGLRLQVRFTVDGPPGRAPDQLSSSPPVRDPLTHVFNRAYIDDRLRVELSRASRTRESLAVLMLEVDCLAEVTAPFGKAAGDRALCSVAARILRVLGAGDLLARDGGDEFLVLAVGGGAGYPRQLAENIRCAVERLHMSSHGREVHIKASIGLATLAELASPHEPAAALLELAGRRMYAAKTSGRNRVCATGPR